MIMLRWIRGIRRIEKIRREEIRSVVNREVRLRCLGYVH